jgi:hypothetical protein
MMILGRLALDGRRNRDKRRRGRGGSKYEDWI